MDKQIRLDKYLADMGVGTRSEVKKYIRQGRVMLDGEQVKQGDQKVSMTDNQILFDNRPVNYSEFEYYMLNKPAGVVSATRDNTSETVIDIITSSICKDLFPVGRLDKDTEGLLIITNDGDLAHKLLSPKNHVGKKYYAKIQGMVTCQHIELFAKGLELDTFHALPAELHILKSGEISEVELTIYEGKFHQVKRMFETLGQKVTYLKRLSMGKLVLDMDLAPGDYRPLTQEEVVRLKEQ